MPGILQEQIGVMIPLITRDFTASQVSGVQTNLALVALSTHNGATISALLVSGIAFPFGGLIVGLSLSCSAAPGGSGSVSIAPTVNGTPASALAVPLISTVSAVVATWEYGQLRFNPGDLLGVVLSQPATIAAAYDAVATLYIMLNEARF